MKTAAVKLAMLAAVAGLAFASPADDVAPEKDHLDVSLADAKLEIGLYVDNPKFFPDVSSGSDLASVAVKGLPLGVTFDKNTLSFKGAAKKQGVYYVTVSAKNKNGFTCSATAEWTVGGAANGDYDNIGIDWGKLEDFETEAPVEWRTGHDVSFSLWYALDGSVADIVSLSASGLPSGIKEVKCASNGAPCGIPPGTYYGMPAKPGKYKVTVTAKTGDKKTHKAVKTVIVEDSGCTYFRAIAPDPEEGTATGTKVYAYGSTVKLSAKAKKGWYFAGWYEDEDFDVPFKGTASGSSKKASDSFVITPDSPKALYARFVDKDEDNVEIIFGEDIDCSWTWEIDVSGDYDYFDARVESVTDASLTWKNLPANVKWNKAESRLEANVAKLKPGIYKATALARSISGYEAEPLTLTIIVPNIENEEIFGGLDYDPYAYSGLVAGVAENLSGSWVEFTADKDWKVTASGLPSGLKLEKGPSSYFIRGTPAKPGAYTVTLIAKKGRIVETATITIVVGELPERAIGTFYGTITGEVPDEGDAIIGTFVFTAGANGKLSCKVTTGEGTVSLSKPSWYGIDGDGNLKAYFYMDDAKQACSFEINWLHDAIWDCDKQLEGRFWWKSLKEEETEIEGTISAGQLSPLGWEPVAGNFRKLFEMIASEYKSKKMVLDWNQKKQGYIMTVKPGVDDGVPHDGEVTLTVNAKTGVPKISGKITGGYSISASGVVIFDAGCVENPEEVYFDLPYNQHYYGVFGTSVKINGNNVWRLVLWHPLGDGQE